MTNRTAAPAVETPEPSMAEYAAQWGKKPDPAPAENVEALKTDAPAADNTATNKPAENVTAPETEDAEPESKIEDSHPAKKGVAKRIGELSDKAKAAQAEAETARKDAETARAELAELKAEAEKKAAETIIPQVPDAASDPVPAKDAFDDPDAYAQAMAAHAARSEIRKATEAAHATLRAHQEAVAAKVQEAQQAQAHAEMAKLHSTFQERITQAKAELPDFDTVVTNNQSLQVRNDIFFAIERAELAPQILYRLAQNPAEAQALNQLDPMSAAIKLGEYQAEIKASKKSTPSRAAEPVKPITARTSPLQKSLDEMSMDEYAAHMSKQSRKR